MYKDSIASTSTYTKMNVKTYMHLLYISVSFSILRYTSTHYIIDSMGLIILLQCIIHIHHQETQSRTTSVRASERKNSDQLPDIAI